MAPDCRALFVFINSYSILMLSVWVMVGKALGLWIGKYSRIIDPMNVGCWVP